VRIFELLGFADDTYLDRGKALQYEKALAKYRNGDFEEAKKRFEANAGDPPSMAMAARCDALIAGKTELEDGVYAMKTK
jgi:hypothetical protein